MDWFERLTGFREVSYEATRAKLRVEGGRLHSLVNGKTYGVGEFELASLQTLRERGAAVRGMSGRLKVSVVTGDVRQMHQAPECAGALIQVASQFNVLEMTGPSVSPEEGVTRYAHDRTQGPACAIAAGATTIFRNYFVPVAGDIGQTATRQIDGLAGVGEALSGALGRSIATLWRRLCLVRKRLRFHDVKPLGAAESSVEFANSIASTANNHRKFDIDAFLNGCCFGRRGHPI